MAVVSNASRRSNSNQVPYKRPSLVDPKKHQRLLHYHLEDMYLVGLGLFKD